MSKEGPVTRVTPTTLRRTPTSRASPRVNEVMRNFKGEFFEANRGRRIPVGVLQALAKLEYELNKERYEAGGATGEFPTGRYELPEEMFRERYPERFGEWEMYRSAPRRGRTRETVPVRSMSPRGSGYYDSYSSERRSSYPDRWGYDREYSRGCGGYY